MAINVYLMIKVTKTDGGNGYREVVSELEAMPEVTAVQPVSGEYDLVVEAAIDIPTRVRVLADKIEAKKSIEGVVILKVEPAEPNPFLDEVCSLPGGECVRWCMQCGTCSASCPNVSQMDHSPRKIIALIRAGRRYDVLTSNTMWVCASCYLCTARCPKDVKITELMHSLERLAARHNLRNEQVSTPAMYKAFIDSIKNNGRVFEVGMMLRFYLSSLLAKPYLQAVLTRKANPLDIISMLPLALKLMSHGRMALKPKKIKGVEQLKTIVEKAQALGGAR